MRSRLLLVLLLLLTTACTKKDETAAKPESSSKNAAASTEPTADEIAAAEKKAEAEAELAEAAKAKAAEEAELAEAAKAAEEAELAEAAKAKAESEAAAMRLTEATDNFTALSDELDAEMKAHMLARRKAKSREEAMEFAKTNPSPLLAFGPQFIEFAKKYAGTEEAKKAIAMIAARGSGDSKTEAVELMIKDHVDDDKLAQIVSTMSRGMPSPQNEKWLNQIIEHTSNAKTKGSALVAKAGLIDSIASFKGALASATKEQLATVDKEVIEFVNAERDAEDDRNKIVGLMEAFVKDHSAEASIVERELFGLKYLGIGCEAPEIAGIDLDDKDFKLSDYRGKVVLLDFWGDW